MRRALAFGITMGVLGACSSSPPPVDAGMEVVDAGPSPTPCSAPESCALAGVPGVCRQQLCQREVPCSDDLECGLGERCEHGNCNFFGCTKDTDCSTGKCMLDTFSCVECGRSADCPSDRPVCGAANTCVRCGSDAECVVPGPPYCSPAGECVHCLTDAQCPNGLACSAGHVCTGVLENQPCPMGTACASGLSCVLLGGNPVCLKSCSLYKPSDCMAPDICYRLTYSGTISLVFEANGPIGVCYQAQAGARNLRDPCARSSTGSNCQPNLWCVPETAQVSSCRAFCDPNVSGSCNVGDHCTAFPGDQSGRAYGLCLPDNGFGEPCTNDSQCRSGLSCQPYDDPSATYSLSGVCQFNVGAAPGLAPCADQPLSDGGIVPANRQCQSGLCEPDPTNIGGPQPYFCFSACKDDSDCRVGPRTGVCDSQFSYTSPYGTMGDLFGCRPGCTSVESCQEYGPGVACRVRLVASYTPTFTSACSPATATGAPGDHCSFNAQCRSNFCMLQDGRGVERAGFCADPCTNASQCASPDGGSILPVGCQSQVVFGYVGFDGTPGTIDDRLLVESLCTGGSCSVDSDCQPDGGSAVCAVDVDPANLTGGVVKRCLPSPQFAVKRGGDPCFDDIECVSGVCGVLQAPSTGSGRACFEACSSTGPATCPASTSCRVGGLLLPLAAGSVNLDSCAP